MKTCALCGWLCLLALLAGCGRVDVVPPDTSTMNFEVVVPLNANAGENPNNK